MTDDAKGKKIKVSIMIYDSAERCSLKVMEERWKVDSGWTLPIMLPYEESDFIVESFVKSMIYAKTFRNIHNRGKAGEKMMHKIHIKAPDLQRFVVCD